MLEAMRKSKYVICKSHRGMRIPLRNLGCDAASEFRLEAILDVGFTPMAQLFYDRDNTIFLR